MADTEENPNTVPEAGETEPAAEDAVAAANESPVAEAEAPVDAAEATSAEVLAESGETPTDAVTEGEPPADDGAEKNEGGEIPEPSGEPAAEPAEPAEAAEGTEVAEGEPTGEAAEGEKTPENNGEELAEAPEAEGGEAGVQAEEREEAEGDTDKPESEVPVEGEAADAEAPAEGEKDEPAHEDEEAPADETIPQSDTFADGEAPQSPAPHVGEVLSREGTPKGTPPPVDEVAMTPPEPLSPRVESREEGEGGISALDEELLSPEQDREALIDMYHQIISEREQLQQQNHQLQHKLAEYFKKKKSDEQKGETVDKNEADQEQRYLKYMSQLEELRTEDSQIREAYAREIEELQRRCDEKQAEVEQHRAQFVEFKHQVALNAINSRSGKPIPPKDIEVFLSAENRKDQEVIQVRLENIKLKNKLKKKEQQLKSKEELADGLHLIDFEQLKIENQTYNEKIEERNEELLKLRKKITNTVQVLTHLKEKLQFVQGENTLLKSQLKDVEVKVAQKRDVLTRTKQARDALRIDNHRLRQNCGLLGNEPLLRDFEERKDEADELKERLERLKMQHAELTLNTTSVRRKIEQIRAVPQE